MPPTGKDNAKRSHAHLQRSHGIDPTPTPTNTKLDNVRPASCRVGFPTGLKAHTCPVPGWLGRTHSRAGLHLHFTEGGQPLPSCSLCNMHVSKLTLNRGHQNMTACRKGTEHQWKCRLLAERHRGTKTIVKAMGEDLEKARQFCCLGRTLDQGNSDWPASMRNLHKAHLKWALIARPLIGTVVPKVVGMFCKAIMQAVSLCGSKTWVVMW